jgi:hypothetical protein
MCIFFFNDIIKLIFYQDYPHESIFKEFLQNGRELNKINLFRFREFYLFIFFTVSY